MLSLKYYNEWINAAKCTLTIVASSMQAKQKWSVRAFAIDGETILIDVENALLVVECVP